MRGGQAVVTAIFIVLVLILAASFYFYFTGGVELTGKSVERKVTLIERQSIAENLVMPNKLMIVAPIGISSREEFEITNYNDRDVTIKCDFPPFQDYVPSSNCFALDEDGDFLTYDEVLVPPGETQMFSAVVTPFKDRRVQDGRQSVVVDIKEGSYHGEVEIEAWVEEDGERDISIRIIPVEIIVED